MDVRGDDILASMERQGGALMRQVALLEAQIKAIQREAITPQEDPETQGDPE